MKEEIKAELKQLEETLTDRITVIEEEIPRLWNKPPRCEFAFIEKITSHEKQLKMINHRLKPYKKNPPIVYQDAKTIYMKERRRSST